MLNGLAKGPSFPWASYMIGKLNELLNLYDGK